MKILKLLLGYLLSLLTLVLNFLWLTGDRWDCRHTCGWKWSGTDSNPRFVYSAFRSSTLVETPLDLEDYLKEVHFCVYFCLSCFLDVTTMESHVECIKGEWPDWLQCNVAYSWTLTRGSDNITPASSLIPYFYV